MDSDIDMQDVISHDDSDMGLSRNLEKLKVAISDHFADIRWIGSSVGPVHAQFLKHHVDQMLVMQESTSLFEWSGERVNLNAWLGSFPLIEEPSLEGSIGLLALFPREIRDTIYNYVLSAGCLNHIETCDCGWACDCSSALGEGYGGLGLLQTCRHIYQEFLPFVYREDVFGFSVGYELNTEVPERPGVVTWIDPVFYVNLGVERQVIPHPPRNVLHLVRNLEINLINDNLLCKTGLHDTFWQCLNRYQCAIEDVCLAIKECSQIRLLDISMTFGCKYDDIESMKTLLEPLKYLRGIQEPHITVLVNKLDPPRSVSRGDYKLQMIHSENINEARWTLTDEYTELLERSMALPLGEPSPDLYDTEVFLDSFQLPEGDPGIIDFVYMGSPFTLAGNEDEFVKAYLRDVYDTDDPHFLEGNMPARWQRWLKKKYTEDDITIDNEEEVPHQEASSL